MTRTRLLVAATALILGCAVAELTVLVQQTVAVTVPEWEFGQDHRFYVDAARRWVETGSFYLEHQTTGPYNVTLMVDVLYPPPALYLFVPFVWLPWILWWLIPLATVVGVVVWLRPAIWSWPLLGLIVLWPRTLGAVIYGNSDMWVAAGLAAGFRWGWPAAAVALKPTFAPLALFLGRDRRFWIGLGGLAIASLPMIGLWLEYVEAIRNLRIGWDYQFGSLPLVAFPLVAAFASRSSRLAMRSIGQGEGDAAARGLRDVAGVQHSRRPER